jgi:hypothetical protein
MILKKCIFLSIITFCFFTLLNAADVPTPTIRIEPNEQLTEKGKPMGNGAVWFEKWDDQGEIRKDYIRLSAESGLIFFYQHGRGIEPILGHFKQLILVNDQPAHLSNEVHMVDLKNRKNWRIDGEVLTRYSSLYLKEFKSLPQKIQKTYVRDLQKNYDSLGLTILPIAKGFSPDDSQALIQMTLCMVTDPTDINKFKNRSYVVNSKSGKILIEYKTDKIPDHWWVDQN